MTVQNLERKLIHIGRDLANKSTGAAIDISSTAKVLEMLNQHHSFHNAGEEVIYYG